MTDRAAGTDKRSQHTEMVPARAPQGTVTGRALVIGAFGSLAIGLGAPWAEHVLRGSYMALDFSTPAAIFLLFVLAAVPQLLLWKMRSPLRLTTAEIVTIFSMMVVASAIPTMGLTAQIIPITTGAYYYVSPENKWDTVILPEFPQWAAPVGAEPGAPVIKYLYEGLPLGRSVPWRAWLPMLGMWMPFILALYLVMIAMMVLLRRQWVDNERLTYPLTHLPLELAGADSGGFPALLKNKMFWLGLAVPVFFGVLTGLHAYFPQIPAPKLIQTLPVFRKQMSLEFRLSFPMVGFFYLVTTEASFSLWFFNRIFFIIRGILSILGVSGGETMGVFGTTEPYFAHLGTGAFIALVASNLWVSRRHFSRVWQAVRGSSDSAYEAGEIMSFRLAFWAMVVGLAFMGWWLAQTGMPYIAVPVFLAFAFVFFLGLTRAVVEAGFAEAVAPKIAPAMTISWLGTGAMGHSGIVASGLAYVWCSDIRTFVMCSVANSLKMAQGITHKRHLLLWGFLIAIVVSFASSFWLTLTRAYIQGGVTMNDWFFKSGPNLYYKYVADKIANPTGPAWYGMGLAAAGGLIYALLTTMRFRYPSWPFHPLGFAIGSVWIMDPIWFTCLVAWALKSLILRYGGNKQYTFLRPAFLGLICGQFTINALWLIVDQITGKTGNMIFWI